MTETINEQIIIETDLETNISTTIYIWDGDYKQVSEKKPVTLRVILIKKKLIWRFIFSEFEVFDLSTRDVLRLFEGVSDYIDVFNNDCLIIRIPKSYLEQTIEEVLGL